MMLLEGSFALRLRHPSELTELGTYRPNLPMPPVGVLANGALDWR